MLRFATGRRTLFMVSTRESAHRVDERVTFVDASVAAGVRHVIYTSLYGAAADGVFSFARDHWATEEHIRASGLRWHSYGTACTWTSSR